MESLGQGSHSSSRRLSMRPQTAQTAEDRPAGRPVQPSAAVHLTAQDTPPSRGRRLTIGPQTAGDRPAGWPAQPSAAAHLTAQDTLPSRGRRLTIGPQTAGHRPAGWPAQPSAAAHLTAQDTPPSRDRRMTIGPQTAEDTSPGWPVTSLATVLLSSQDTPLSWSRRLAMISPRAGDKSAGQPAPPSTSAWLKTQDTLLSKDKSLTARDGSFVSAMTLDATSHLTSQNTSLSMSRHMDMGPQQTAGSVTIGPLTTADAGACLIIQDCPRAMGRRFSMGPHIVRDRALRRPTLADASMQMTTEESPRRSRHFSDTLQTAGEEAAGPSMPPDGTPLRAQEHALIKKPLGKKRAMCDFRVRWPEVTDQDNQNRKVHETFEVRSPSSAGSSTSGLALSITDLESCPSDYQASQGDETATQPDLAEAQDGLADEGPQSSPQKSPYMTILDSFLKSETLTRRERRMKKRTMAKLSQLEVDTEAARRRQKEQLEKSRALQEELAHQKASSKPFLELLQQKTDECERKHDDLWNQYIQECRDIRKRRKEREVTYALQSAALHKQLMEGRKTQASLNKKLIALKPIALIKEGQDKTIQALQEEKERLAQETLLKDREAHFQFLQEKAALEKQLEEMNRLELGEDITWELKKKAKAFERAARKGYQDFCQNMRQENRQLQEDLWQMDREWRKLEATKERLEKQKQWCKAERSYLESLTRGRRRLQEQGESSRQRPRQQSGPDNTQDSSLGAEARANPGHWLPCLRK